MKPEVIESTAAFIKGAGLFVAKTMELKAARDAEVKTAAELAAQVSGDTLKRAGLIDAQDVARCDELLKTHTGTLELFKWACSGQEKLLIKLAQVKDASLLDNGQPAASPATPGRGSYREQIDREMAGMRD